MEKRKGEFCEKLKKKAYTKDDADCLNSMDADRETSRW